MVYVVPLRKMRQNTKVLFRKIYKQVSYYNHRTTSTLFITTTVMAFAFGFAVGVLLPIYVFTNNYSDPPADGKFVAQPMWNRTESTILEPSLQLASPIKVASNSSDDRAQLFSVLFSRNLKMGRKLYKSYHSSNYGVPDVPGDFSTETSDSIDSAKRDIEVLLINETEDRPSIYKNAVKESNKMNSKKFLNHHPSDGIFWSSELERHLPKGFGDDAFDNWRQFVNKSVIVKVEEGCGRMQNRQVTFDDGVKACCRYRQNNDQIQGEIFSFYLARLLGIENLPPSALAIVRGNEWQWDYVRSYIQLAQWSADRPVVLTQFVDKLSSSYIPKAFRNASRSLHPLDQSISGTFEELIELVQWSDLIIFDYITANLDRVVNNMYNEQWNSEMMKSPAHNLAKSDSTGLLLFLDNESGLLHGYRLLDKYEHYHLSLLQSLCIFKQSTVRAVESLRNKRNVSYLLKQMFETVSPHMRDWLPFIPDRYLKILGDRIEKVYQHMLGCHKRYGGGSFKWKNATS